METQTAKDQEISNEFNTEDNFKTALNGTISVPVSKVCNKCVGNVDEREFRTYQNRYSDLCWYAAYTKCNEKLVVVLWSL
jgi:hypothetical protein